jgi:hypothetical protein
MYDRAFFDKVVDMVRLYFSREYHAGTREMIHRYVCRKMGYVPPKMISAALKILKLDGSILWEKHVWWNTGSI